MDEAVSGTNSATEKTKEGIAWHSGGAAVAGDQWSSAQSPRKPGASSVCLLNLDWIWHLEWWLISIVNLTGLGVTWETPFWGCLGGFSREALLRQEDPPWSWLAPSHGLGFWTKWKQWKECQNSLFPLFFPNVKSLSYTFQPPHTLSRFPCHSGLDSP